LALPLSAAHQELASFRKKTAALVLTPSALRRLVAAAHGKSTPDPGDEAGPFFIFLGRGWDGNQKPDVPFSFFQGRRETGWR
jgi:hypothetical protein